MNEIEKGLVIFLLVVFICCCITFWYAANKCIQLETQIKSLKINTSFMIGALERDLEVLEANLIRLKKGQW